MPTLVIDTGQDIVGVLSVADYRYIPYRGKEIIVAVRLIEEAEEVVTYNGADFDLKELGRFAGLATGHLLRLKGHHSDMRSVCWSDRIWRKSLRDTYSMHFTDLPPFPDTHEGDNYRDVYMTLKLWELWNLGQLKVLDGNIV